MSNNISINILVSVNIDLIINSWENYNMFDLLNWNYLIKSLHLYYPPPLSTSSLIVFKEYTFNFAWAICFQWQITELILSFIPTINGSYSDRIFSERICSIWWFKYFIRGRWDCLIIVNITAESESIFKDWRKRAVEWFIYKEYALYKYFVFKVENMVRFK